MKKFVLSLMFLGWAFVSVPRFCFAVDPLEAGPDIYHKVFENDRVRVLEVTFAPGASISMHTHPDHFAYALTDGKLVITDSDGKVTNAEFKTGDTIWMKAVTHSAVNPGTTEAKLLVVELKEPAMKK